MPSSRSSTMSTSRMRQSEPESTPQREFETKKTRKYRDAAPPQPRVSPKGTLGVGVCRTQEGPWAGPALPGRAGWPRRRRPLAGRLRGLAGLGLEG